MVGELCHGSIRQSGRNFIQPVDEHRDAYESESVQRRHEPDQQPAGWVRHAVECVRLGGQLDQSPENGAVRYDAENRLLAATSVGATYAYDGLGGGYRRQPRQGPLTMFTTQTVSWRRNTVRSARPGERCS